MLGKKVLCVHSGISRGRIPGCSLKPWAWNEKKKIDFDLFLFWLILAHILNWIFMSRITFSNYVDWSVEVGPQIVIRRCQFLLCVGWKRSLQFRHPVDLSVRQKSFIMVNCSSQCNKNCMRVRRRQRKQEHFCV